MFPARQWLIIAHLQEAGCHLKVIVIKGGYHQVMTGIEKYTLSDGQTGWQARLLVKGQVEGTDRSGTLHSRRFSYARYGERAFQKALEWFENRYYQTAETSSKSPATNTNKLQEI